MKERVTVACWEKRQDWTDRGRYNERARIEDSGDAAGYRVTSFDPIESAFSLRTSNPHFRFGTTALACVVVAEEGSGSPALLAVVAAAATGESIAVAAMTDTLVVLPGVCPVSASNASSLSTAHSPSVLIPLSHSCPHMSFAFARSSPRKASMGVRKLASASASSCTRPYFSRRTVGRGQNRSLEMRRSSPGEPSVRDQPSRND